MPQIAKELKAELLRQGRWAEFIEYREGLKERGMSNTDALHEAIKKYFTKNPEILTEDQHRARAKKEKKQRAKDGGKKAPISSVFKDPPGANEQVEEGVGSSSPDPSSSSPSGGRPEPPPLRRYVGDLPSLPPVSKLDFDGKQCSETQSIRWVADNMQVTDPDPADCPSAAAWGLLAQCRESITSRNDFWKQTFPKLLPTKAQMEKKGDGKPNEARTMEIIDEMLQFKEEAETLYESSGKSDDEVEQDGAIDCPDPEVPDQEDPEESVDEKALCEEEEIPIHEPFATIPIPDEVIEKGGTVKVNVIKEGDGVKFTEGKF